MSNYNNNRPYYGNHQQNHRENSRGGNRQNSNNWANSSSSSGTNSGWSQRNSFQSNNNTTNYQQTTPFGNPEPRYKKSKTQQEWNRHDQRSGWGNNNNNSARSQQQQHYGSRSHQSHQSPYQSMQSSKSKSKSSESSKALPPPNPTSSSSTSCSRDIHESTSNPTNQEHPTINKTNWKDDEYTITQKFEAQHPDLDYERTTSKVEDIIPPECLKEDTKEWEGKKKAACDEAVKQVIARIKYDRDTEDEDYDSDYDSDDPRNHRMFDFEPDGEEFETIRIFFDALQYNVVFTAGFDVLGISEKDYENCFCPCSRKMIRWRKAFGVDGIEEEDQCDRTGTATKKMLPNALMAHLEKKSECSGSNDHGAGGYLHWGIAVYLKTLYGDWNDGIGHKALFKPGERRYNEIVAAEKRQMIRARKEVEKQLKEEQRKNKEAKERNDLVSAQLQMLRIVNVSLYKKICLEANIDADSEITPEMINNINLDEKKDKVVLTDAMMEGHRRQARFIFKQKMEDAKCCQAYKKSRANTKPPIETMSEVEPKPYSINIKLDADFNLQKWFDEQLIKNSDETGLFSDLDATDDWKLFLEWKIEFDVERALKRKVKGNRTRKHHRLKEEIESDEAELKAVDEGGPMSKFVSEFCKQMGDLVLFIPIKNSKRKEGKAEALTVEVGCKVKTKKHKDEEALVTKVKRESGEMLCDFQLEVVKEHSENSNEVVEERELEVFKDQERSDYKITAVPVKLFEQTDEGFIPNTEDVFTHKYESLKKYKPAITKEEMEMKARRMYRAIGRFLLHCMADGRNALWSSIMPKFFMNVILRNCAPGSDSYPKDDVIADLKRIGLLTHEYKEWYLNKKFSDVLYDEREDFVITEDNIASKFVPRSFLDTRKLAIDALQDGMTLGGRVNIGEFFSSVPVEAVEKIFFAPAEIEASDVIDILTATYAEFPDEETILDNQKLFVKELKTFLVDRGESDKTFLPKFVEFITGSKFLPDKQGNPDYRINIEFSFALEDANDNNLPKAYTCDKVMIISGFAYSNDMDTFGQKLDMALDLCGKFTMN